MCKKFWILWLLCLLLLTGCAVSGEAAEKIKGEIPVPETAALEEPAIFEATTEPASATVEQKPITLSATALAEPISNCAAFVEEWNGQEETRKPELTAYEQDLLLRLAMAEVGTCECVECMALVMCVVLNRVESDRFASTIYRVIYTEGQFTPVQSGKFESAYPNELCYEALAMVMSGWDESQGALFFESNPGECWHSRNCEFLFKHCVNRFWK